MVFPAYAGVFLAARPCPRAGCSLPRIRGGVSFTQTVTIYDRQSSPHTRGCFCPSPLRAPSGHVFPAYAGVFLDDLDYGPGVLSLPRIRGGVSGRAVGY